MRERSLGLVSVILQGESALASPSLKKSSGRRGVRGWEFSSVGVCSSRSILSYPGWMAGVKD